MIDGPPRLTKADVERLVESIDSDSLHDTLIATLRLLLRIDPQTHPHDILEAAARAGGWGMDRLRALQSSDTDALAQLAVDLAELRVLSPERNFGDEGH